MKHTLVLIVAGLSLTRGNSESIGSLRGPSDKSPRFLQEENNGYFPCGSKLFCVSDRSMCENNSKCTCLPGFSGLPLCEPEDECKADAYPCAGGNKEGSFCVNMAPPEAYKCSCLPGFDAVLPDQADVTDPVPAACRPIACVRQDAVGSAASPVPTSKAPAAPTPSPTMSGFCNVSIDCVGNNYVCNTASNQCVCPKGFV